MKVEVSYEQAKTINQEATSELVNSIPDGVDPSNQKWILVAAEKIEGFSFKDIVSGKAEKKKKERKSKSYEERVEDRLSNMSVFLKVIGDDFELTDDEEFSEIPDVVGDKVKKQVKNRMEEEKRVENLSEEEEAREETQEALKELGFDPAHFNL